MIITRTLVWLVIFWDVMISTGLYYDTELHNISSNNITLEVFERDNYPPIISNPSCISCDGNWILDNTTSINVTYIPKWWDENFLSQFVNYTCTVNIDNTIFICRYNGTEVRAYLPEENPPMSLSEKMWTIWLKLWSE